ncbi:MAG TPA: hypothetical protein VKA53_05925 [Thermoanaerobaculia bacterium]|nr:hypothetical protein [Thermoanaerobaculia bacterium]
MSRRSVILGVLVATVLAIGVAAPSTAVPSPRWVYLQYNAGKPAPDCISIFDDKASIFLSKPPSNVEWMVSDPHDAHQWVIEYKDGSGVIPGPAQRTIPCGERAYISPNASKTGDWIYKVSVYNCKNGKPDGGPICETDPVIIIYP